MNTQEQTVKKAIQDLTDSLTVEGRLAVAEHVLSRLAAKDLKKLSPKARQDLLATLPKGDQPQSGAQGVVTDTTVAPHKMCNLKVLKIALGTQVTFTIPKGMSGKMVLDAIEKSNPRSPGDGVVQPESALLKDAGLSDIVAEDTKYTTTVCFNSSYRNRNQQASYLKDNGLGFTDRWITTVAAALYRDANGFPENRSKIGTSKDKGDLFKGLVARARSGVVGSTNRGVSADFCFSCRDAFFDGYVIAAGSSLSN
jgi:hypothetical protein